MLIQAGHGLYHFARPLIPQGNTSTRVRMH